MHQPRPERQVEITDAALAGCVTKACVQAPCGRPPSRRLALSSGAPAGVARRTAASIATAAGSSIRTQQPADTIPRGDVSAVRVWLMLPSFFHRWLLSLGGRGAGMPCKIAASTATAAGSSIRSGNPCSTRERRASSAPAFLMASRSSSLRVGCRAGMSRSALVPSSVPLSAYARLRADTRARGGTGRPSGRSLTVTAPQWSARASAPGRPG